VNDVAALRQTATILALKDVKKEDSKDDVAKAIVDFLIAPKGKTFEEQQKDDPEPEAEPELPESEEEEEEEEEEEVKPKAKKRGGQSSTAGRPKRATASRVWTNGLLLLLMLLLSNTNRLRCDCRLRKQ